HGGGRRRMRVLAARRPRLGGPRDRWCGRRRDGGRCRPAVRERRACGLTSRDGADRGGGRADRGRGGTRAVRRISAGAGRDLPGTAYPPTRRRALPGIADPALMQAEPETTSRFRAGLLRYRTFRQLVKFGLVGATGFVINVAVFAFCLRVLDVHYRLASVLGFCVAVTNNFIWNRVWTFRHERDASHMAMQGARFFAVSLLAAAAGFVLLDTLARLRLPQIPDEDVAPAHAR